MFNEGADDWTAIQQPAPMMMMQQQDDGAGDALDAFADANIMESAPVVTIQTASGASQNLDDDLTEEEKEIVVKATELQESLRAEIHSRVMEEAQQKQQRRNDGLASVQQWHQEREGQISLRKQNNEEHERQFHTHNEEDRQRNPWERVVNNCDVTLQGVSAGGHDKTRMKQAMLNRKSDLTSGATPSSFNL